jgi:hypothetical protein
MEGEHDYYSDQCAECKWAEWRGGCLNKATAEDGSDLDAADRGECAHFEAGEPQKRPPQPGDRLHVQMPLDDYSALRVAMLAATARAEVAEQRAEAVVADAQAAAHFCQSVAHLLASPGAEAEAVQHLRAADLPHLFDCLRERLAKARAEQAAAALAAAEQRGADRERAAIAATLRLRAKTLRDRRALGLADEIDALAFYAEQRGGR